MHRKGVNCFAQACHAVSVYKCKKLFNGDVVMHAMQWEKSWKQGNPLCNTIKDTICLNIHVRRERLHMIVLVSLIVLQRGFLCCHYFSRGKPKLSNPGRKTHKLIHIKSTRHPDAQSCELGRWVKLFVHLCCD